MKTIRIIIIGLGMALAAWLIGGCTKFTIRLPDKTEFNYEKGLMDATAKRAEFYYEDPNIVVWVIVNDPNSRVHPARLVVPPYMMIETKDTK